MILATVSRKGGVGKTTATCELAAAAARGGRRVLVVDYDPSANASARLGVQPDPALAHAVHGDPVAASALITQTAWGVDAIAGHGLLASVGEDPRPQWPLALRTVLTPFTADYDLILVDTGPSRTRQGYQALVAASAAIAVTTGEEDAVNAIADAITDLTEVAASGLGGQSLSLAGIIVTAAPLSADGTTVRTTAPRELLDAVEEHYGALLWRPYVPHLPAAMARARELCVSSAAIPDAARIAAAYDALASRLPAAAPAAGIDA